MACASLRSRAGANGWIRGPAPPAVPIKKEDFMQIDWILSPLGQCVFLALALIGCLALFLSVKMEIAVVRRSFDQSRESATASTATLATELATLREAIGSTEVTRAPAQELNLSQREQAL